jgi:hypothetical protein
VSFLLSFDERSVRRGNQRDGLIEMRFFAVLVSRRSALLVPMSWRTRAQAAQLTDSVNPGQRVGHWNRPGDEGGFLRHGMHDFCGTADDKCARPASIVSVALRDGRAWWSAV